MTHHIEELPPGVTHAALLRNGRLVAAGPVAATLAGPSVSACFSVDVEVSERSGRWSVRPAGPSGPV